MEFSQIVLTPFSWLLTVFYNIFHSYAFALVLFAIVVKLILFPFSLKGKRSMIQMNLIQGEVQKLQKQYANNREKMNEEVQKLYAKEGVKPMSGCLWSFIPILILWPLYAIIRRPIHYMMGQAGEVILAIAKFLGFSTGTELTAANISAGYNELKIAGMMTQQNLDGVRAAAEAAGGVGSKIFHINFNFLGLDLSQVAQWKVWQFESIDWAHIGLFLLPIISAALGVLMTIVSQKTNNMSTGQAAPQSSQMKSMMIISPLISLWIGFVMPAGLCLYWIINNVLSIVQEIVSGRMLKKDYEKAAAARAERERLEKEEEKRRRQEAAERRARAIEEAKQNRGKKKKPAEKTEKKKPATTDAGRIGMRPYARGRDYDPDRYGGVTPYQDPGAPIDEDAIEKARKAKEEAAIKASAEAKIESGEELTEEEKAALAEAEGVVLEVEEESEETEEAAEAEESAEQEEPTEPTESEESAEPEETPEPEEPAGDAAPEAGEDAGAEEAPEESSADDEEEI